MTELEVIRVREDPDIPKGLADKAFRQAAKDSRSVLVIAWSSNRWSRAGAEWEKRTGKKRPAMRFYETDHERWDFPARTDFPGALTAQLSGHPVKLLVVTDDFVILPPGMPGGHLFSGAVGYCPICDIWHDGKGAGC